MNLALRKISIEVIVEILPAGASDKSGLAEIHVIQPKTPGGNICVEFRDSDGTVSVLFGNGDGTFAGQTTVTAASRPSGLAAADFTGDGVPDLTVGTSPASIGSFKVRCASSVR